MSIRLRPFEEGDADYEILSMLWNATFPDMPKSASLLKWEAGFRPDDVFRRRVIAETPGGEAVGYGVVGESWHNATPNTYGFFFCTLPDYQNQGAASQFFDESMQTLRERKAVSVSASSREDRPQGIDFLRNRGFEQTMRIPKSELNLATFDRNRFGDPQQKMATKGIRILSLSELSQQDDEWQEKVYELDWALVKDVPSTEPHKKISLETFLKVFEAPDFNPDLWLIAVDDQGNFVGASNVWHNRESSPHLFETGLTGVLATHRRQGIATALKLCIIDLGREMGVEKIITDNEENNPMFGINLRLGFEEQPAWLSFKKSL